MIGTHGGRRGPPQSVSKVQGLLSTLSSNREKSRDYISFKLSGKLVNCSRG